MSLVTGRYGDASVGKGAPGVPVIAYTAAAGVVVVGAFNGYGCAGVG